MPKMTKPIMQTISIILNKIKNKIEGSVVSTIFLINLKNRYIMSMKNSST